ncbi:MAG: hypothetical protein FH753_03120 [Firmicutes bacterium]|nr:hypothetical protein [Bacillota bacterium]
MSKRTYYIHVGTGKTGTTALQQFFNINKNTLQKRGITYPETGIFNNSGAHHNIIWSIYKGTQETNNSDYDGPNRNEMFNLLSKELKDKPNKVLLSSEFVSYTRSGLKQLKEFFQENIKIILYIRRQDEFIQSVNSQWIKVGNRTTISSTDINGNYLAIIENIVDIFGRDNLILRPYEKQQFYNSSIFADFLNYVFGLKLDKSFQIPKSNPNPSLDRNALEYKRLINKLNISRTEKQSILPELKNYSISSNKKVFLPFSKHKLLSPKEKLDIIRKYDKINKKIAKEYLNREDEQLFYDEIPSENEKYKSYKTLSIEEAIDISRHLLSKIYSEDVDKMIINSIIRGTIEEITGNKIDVGYLRDKEFRKLTYIYDLLNKIPKHYKNITNFEINEKGLSFMAKDKPKMILPKFNNVKEFKQLRIKIDITIPEPTKLKVLYRGKENNFEENNSKSIKLLKKRNCLYFDIESYENIDKILLAPGIVKGNYTIHSLSIRGVKNESDSR